LRQLRELAKGFAARQTDRKKVEREMRLLSQPICRYATDGGDVIDGGVFAFVVGTDPEVVLLIEARKADGVVTWQFGLARMASIAVRVAYRGNEVWSVPTLPWPDGLRIRTEPYILFQFGTVGAVSPQRR
jgi:hypothetical protein